MSIAENIHHVRARIKAACEHVGRDPASVRLVLATKTVDPERLREAVAAGEHVFGENRAQEALPKVEALSDVPIEWHFIGHLQSNKVRDVLRFASCIQSVDRSSLVDALNAECSKQNKKVDVLIEVNASGEPSKHGCSVEDADALMRHLAGSPWLRVRGFMTIGAMSDDEHMVRASFAQLRRIRDDAIAGGLVPHDATELSMGMSGDMEIAIAEGSTMVRVGSAVFGGRT